MMGLGVLGWQEDSTAMEIQVLDLDPDELSDSASPARRSPGT